MVEADAQPVGVDENRVSNGELAKKRTKMRLIGGNAKCCYFRGAD